MFRDGCRKQAFALKFRMPSIQLTSEAFVCNRKMSEMEIGECPLRRSLLEEKNPGFAGILKYERSLLNLPLRRRLCILRIAAWAITRSSTDGLNID